MGRKFYKNYQKEINIPSTELSDEMSAVLPVLQDKKNIDGVELLLYNLGIKSLERRICLSRIKGERGTEFLRRNKRVTQKQYNDALKRVRDLLKDVIDKNQW